MSSKTWLHKTRYFEEGSTVFVHKMDNVFVLQNNIKTKKTTKKNKERKKDQV